MVKVVATGTFDYLHPGHINYLKQAKRFGKLFVIVARAPNIKKFKGKKSILSEKDRLELVKSLKFVDKAVLGDKKDILKPVEKIKPNIIFLGYDQKVDLNWLKTELRKRKIKAKIVRAKAYKQVQYKSSFYKNVRK